MPGDELEETRGSERARRGKPQSSRIVSQSVRCLGVNRSLHPQSGRVAKVPVYPNLPRDIRSPHSSAMSEVKRFDARRADSVGS